MQNRKKIKILYLCTGNSCRSQMAEALTNSLRGNKYQAASAGVKPGRLDARAVKAMAELGMDISHQRSKDLGGFKEQSWDLVVTLCDNARESCPLFSGGAKVVHRGFEDPPYLAVDAAGEEEAMGHYRRVRDEIKQMVLGLPGSLESTR